MLTLGFPKISTDLASVKGVRIVPFGDRYNIELIFNFDPQDLHLTKAHILGMDLAKKQAKERAKKQAKERAFDQAIQEKDRIIQKLKTEIQRLKDAWRRELLEFFFTINGKAWITITNSNVL